MDAVSTLIWIYVVTKLFVFDADRALLQWVVPDLLFILDYRLLVFLLVLAIIAFRFGPIRTLAGATYVFAYPAILIIWKIPATVVALGSWTVGIALANVALSSVTDLTYRLVVTLAYLGGGILIVVSTDRLALQVGTALLTCGVFASFLKAFVDAFRSPPVFKVYRFVSDKVRDISQSPKAGAEPLGKRITAIPKSKNSLYVERLQNQLLLNRLFLFAASRFQDYQGSGVSRIMGLFSAALLYVTSVFSFSFLYFAASKIDPDSIARSRHLVAFDFLYLSFDNSVIVGTHSSAQLVNSTSQWLSLVQRLHRLL